jgi:chitin disaccharide deacetylase
MKATRLIINADDFGWSRSITDGIVRAHEDGIVTSTSFLANQPASDYAISQIPRVPQLGIGIHLNLCSGAPVLPAEEVPSLVGNDGNFHPAPQMLRRLLRWQVSPAEIEAEFRAQIRWARERGVNLGHADTHYGVNVYPLVVKPFQRAVRAEGIKCMRPTRHVVSPRQGILPGAHGGPVYRQLAVDTYMKALRASAFRQFVSPDFQLVLSPNDRSDISRHCDGWRRAFENLLPGTYEAVCHPGSQGAELNAIDNLRERRAVELRIMTDPSLRSAIERRGVELITYHEL